MNIQSVLIANRGEIALRIINACHKIGLRAVAVYSDADRNAPFVDAADIAVHIGASEAAQSYLDGEKIIAAAKRAGADAIHPGYGFLAENAAFAAACDAEGLIFIGPSAKNIRLMGSKIAAKAAAEMANVPVVPGYYGDDQSDEVLQAEAALLGTPLLIKASAGGGGRGMRLVNDLQDFLVELDQARREAKAAFGDDKVLLERFVGKARHIEVQILADQHGNVCHLFERDCSLQRNHQKVIEEAPAPNLDPEIREKLLESAVRLSSDIGYDSAGTIEYLLDDSSGEFYFLEMNTRLQVEHPVTEMVTGIDIVEWQIKAAAGVELPFSQADIICTGWAIEARLAAEDPANSYAPETGIIVDYVEPKIDGLRVDSGIWAGSEISPYYDSMLAKIIGYGSDRKTAIHKLCRGLDGMEITGVGTNIGFLHDLLTSDVFASGAHSTASIAALYPDGWTALILSAQRLAEAVLARQLTLEPLEQSSIWQSLGGWRVTESSGRKGAAIYRVEEAQVHISGRKGAYTVTLPDHPAIHMLHAKLTDNALQYEHDGLRHCLGASVNANTVTLRTESKQIDIDVLTVTEAAHNQTAQPKNAGSIVVAPMPSLVSEVLVKVGDTVTAGQGIVVIEAMKLMQTLNAPCTGTIREILCSTGEIVESGAVLSIIEPED